MADLVGKLIADFSPFYEACQKAEVSLKSFETEAERVEKSLSRMTDQFSGRKVIQDATLMAEAIDRIGGTTKLTEAELARVGNTAAAAVAKMQALGMDVPERLQNLAMHAKDGASALDRMGVAFGSFVGNLAADLVQRGISGVLGLGSAAFETAGKINDLSARLGISAEAVQGFMYAANQSGTTIDTFAAAINKLNLNLAEGDKSTVNALKALGLEYEAIRSMKPEDAFLAIADEVAKIEDPMERVRVGTELMGKGFVEILPAIQDGLRTTVSEVDKMSDETVQRLADAEDAWQALYDKVVIVTGELIAKVLEAAATMRDAVAEMGVGGTVLFSLRSVLAGITGDYSFVADAAAKAGAAIADTTAPTQAAAAAQAQAAESLRELEARQQAEAVAARETAEAHRKAAEELKAWGDVFTKVTAQATPWQDVLAENDDQLNEWIQTLLRAGASIADIAKAYSVSTELVEANSRALKENDDTLKMIEQSYRDLSSLTEQYTRLVEERTLSTTERQINDINRWADAYKAKLMERGTLTTESENMIDAIRTEKLTKLVRETSEAADAVSGAWADTAADTVAGAAQAAQGITIAYIHAAEQVVSSWSEAMDLVRQGQGVMEGVLEPGGPGTMTNYGPWGSTEHKSAIAKAYAQGRYFGPVKTRTGGRESYDVDWQALGMPDALWGGTPTVNNTFHVNGTGQDVARVVLDEITRTMKSSRKWPAV